MYSAHGNTPNRRRSQSRAPIPASRFASRRTTTKPGLRITFLYALAGVLFIAGGLVVWQGFSAKQKTAQQTPVTNKVANDDGSRPATTPIVESAVDSYVVAPNMPRVLTIPKLGVKARIMPLGVTNDNQLKAPSNIYDTGWYSGSSQPGQPGAMLMDGHVSSWSSDGVFKYLNKLAPGDIVIVERGDGQQFQFRVVKSQAYEESVTDMQAALLPVTEGRNGLNLITCYGRVRPGTSEFEQRLIVFTEQI